MWAFGIGNGTHSTLLIYANICSEALFKPFPRYFAHNNGL